MRHNFINFFDEVIEHYLLNDGVHKNLKTINYIKNNLPEIIKEVKNSLDTSFYTSDYKELGGIYHALDYIEGELITCCYGKIEEINEKVKEIPERKISKDYKNKENRNV